jgi:A/G-specific adenine glycosylase
MHGSETEFGQRLLGWYDAHRRDLPWRMRIGSCEPLDPYRVLVSEAMLQQTQVATVVPYFHRFLKRFPTIATLAEADERDVLRAWQGLGYYSRARNLQAAAKRVMADHCGELPRTTSELRRLPGIGRYTAGAVASIAFDCREPIVDGNVVRVLCRLDRVESDPRDRDTHEHLWHRAAQVLPERRCGDFNSALMDLGATVCIPRGPKCLICPVRDHCEAQAAGVQEQIPPPKKPGPTPLLKRDVLCLRRGEKYLIEQRPAKGRWAGMWQFLTIEVGRRKDLATRASASAGGA